MKPAPILLAFICSAAVAQERVPTVDEAVLALKREDVRVSSRRNGGMIVTIDSLSDEADPTLFRNLRYIPNIMEVVLLTEKGDDRLALLPDELRTHLRVIHARNVTDKGLKHVAKHTAIKELYLDGNGITDAGLANLETLKELEKLRLTDTRVTKAGLQKLYKSCPKCLGELR